MPDPVVPNTPAADPNKPADPPAPEKTFTQADIDRIVQERLARAKPADYDDLKARAAKLDEIEAATKTELQKAQDRATAAEDKASKADARALDLAKGNAVYLAAVKAGAIDPDSVYALLDRNAVTIGNDGQVTGAAEAVKALLESKPYLVGKRVNGSAEGGARGAATSGKSMNEIIRERMRGGH